MKFYSFLIAALLLAAISLAQSPTPLTATEKINQVFLSSAASMTPTQIAWQNNILDRCSIIDIPVGTASAFNVGMLSNSPLLTKYGALLTLDSVYDSATFNPLKYMINFTENQDQYFRIGTTSKVLKVGANL